MPKAVCGRFELHERNLQQGMPYRGRGVRYCARGLDGPIQSGQLGRVGPPAAPVMIIKEER